MRMSKTLCLAGVAGLALASAASAQSVAPGAPGLPPVWSSAAKTGAGASYEAYVDGQYRDGGPTGAVSKVWYSIADGILTETMYGLIHEAQIKQLRLAVMTETGLSIEGTDTTSRTEYSHVDAAGRPLSPAYRVTTTDKTGRFEIIKEIFTDPDRNTLVMSVITHALKGEVTPYVILEPHMANTGGGDHAEASNQMLFAHEGNVHLALMPSRSFEASSAGFLGVSDGLTDLQANGRLTRLYASTGDTPGTVVLTGQMHSVPEGLASAQAIYIGFGDSRQAAVAAVEGSGSSGITFGELRARFNGEGERVGWEDYVASLTELPRIAEQSTDGGKLAYASALMLKVQEDRTHAGALIASLSNPWGDTVDASKSSTGYKAVWPRDFYQVAMALAALGDKETPLAAFNYLPQVQVGPNTPGNTGVGGWFLQKTHVDGELEWVAVQLDQTAMPIMLGYRLWKMGWLSDAQMTEQYQSMLKPAADFLVDGGKIGLLWNDSEIKPPFTQQERWEEQQGYSPSSTAAVVAGLTVAAEMARASGDATGATRYQIAADSYASKIEARMFTTNGDFGDGRYFIRITQNENPNDKAPIGAANGQIAPAEDRVVDGGFLELVRYGVRKADDPHILSTLPVYDDQSLEPLYRVRYDFGPEGDKTPGWRRYGVDGYGEDHLTGANYGVGGEMSPGQRGRVWPFFTGERGHYELARVSLHGAPSAADIAAIRQTYVRGMERFANSGLMLAEQVWDGVGDPTAKAYALGQNTDSATPLAWTHAEYLKLLRSLADGKVWDSYDPVHDRYAR
ncbi:glucan 1,4-alpha-glucosidase [Brevundimonas sp. G8]|uniref:glucan 1,4-alpha-glucosidase n=1 Tax=Brevundimonas sp. G8 TaxID=1350776 RepID=UPI0012F21A62|nr:glucan 1,4-alpha-glucosidase [Brevundimonas sp. G8]VXB12570.1 Glucoamylase [Brevundimonas sp. G8]